MSYIEKLHEGLREVLRLYGPGTGRKRCGGKRGKTGCGKYKLPGEFGKCNSKEDGRDVYCLVCTRRKDRVRNKKRNKACLLWKRYRMRPKERQAMLDAQGGCCARCRATLVNGGCLDHAHECCPGTRSCGQCVRAIVCRSCNGKLTVTWCADNPDDPCLVRYAARRAQLEREAA